MQIVALVKHDCPTCDTLLPALVEAVEAGAPLTILSQSTADETAGQARRLGLLRIPELDTDLAESQRLDPDAVPTVVLLDGGDEQARVEGLQRDRLAALFEQAGATLDTSELPAMRPGCASLTRDPEIAAKLAARRARDTGRIRSRTLQVGGLEDPVDALHDRGLTDGLPVVPPTAERVVALLEHTSRDPQDVVGVLPPYGGTATVEKVAINAVMAGCAGPELPIVLAAVEAVSREAFAMHGLLATTHSSGPVVVVSGPYADRAGMWSGVNALGQGCRATLCAGRAVQLTVRNVGGGLPGTEDRATHGTPAKVGFCFAERLDETAPFPGLAHDRLGLAADETGVTVFAGEAPRIVVDQLARDVDALVASLAVGLEHIATPRLRLAFDGMLVLGPEHGRIFREAGWTRQQLQEALHAASHSAAGSLVRGADGIAEGLDPAWVSDPAMPVPKFAGPDRILVAYAGGDAGLFSMVVGGWASGDIGSAPQSARVEDWR